MLCLYKKLDASISGKFIVGMLHLQWYSGKLCTIQMVQYILIGGLGYHLGPYIPQAWYPRGPQKNSSLIKHRISTSYLNIIWQEKHISMENKYGAVEIGGKTHTLIRNNCTLLSMLFSHSRFVLSPTETLETLRIV